MATNKAIGPYWAAPLQPSVEQVSQNSVRMYDGVLVLRHSSLRALMFSQKHDREMTYLSFTRIVAGSRKEQTNKKYISRLKLLEKVYVLHDEFEIVLEKIINQNVTFDWYIIAEKICVQMVVTGDENRHVHMILRGYDYIIRYKI